MESNQDYSAGSLVWATPVVCYINFTVFQFALYKTVWKYPLKLAKKSKLIISSQREAQKQQKPLGVFKLYGQFKIYSDTSANEDNSFRNHIR